MNFWTELKPPPSYAVQNTQPRPESFREDYVTANNESYYASSGMVYPETAPLNDSEKATLYANLATGAETGWDYSTRWLANPTDAANDVYFPLRSLNTINTVSVELNAILYANEMVISEYLAADGNGTGATAFQDLAKARSEAMFSLMWNDTHNSYFDYNLTSGSQNLYVPADSDATIAETDGAPEGHQVFFHVGQYYPFWLGAAPTQLKNNPLAVKLAYQRVEDLLSEKAGAIAATNYQTGQQWDQPNVWPPLMHVLMEGLLKTPATFGEDDPAWIATQDLALRLGQRYLESTFCTWRATGGSTDETPQLTGFDSAGDVGIMFEKYGDNSTNAVGGGGEYEVVEGFGWTNGVLIWVVDTFNNRLTRPDCGNLTAASTQSARRRRGAQGAVELHPSDARWTKRFRRRSGLQAPAAGN